MGASEIAQLMGSLVAVLLAIFGLAWVARRMPNTLGHRSQCLRTHASLPLGARERLVLVQAGPDWVLLGVAPGQIRQVHVLSGPPEDFADVLAAETAK